MIRGIRYGGTQEGDAPPVMAMCVALVSAKQGNLAPMGSSSPFIKVTLTSEYNSVEIKPDDPPK